MIHFRLSIQSFVAPFGRRYIAEFSEFFDSLRTCNFSQTCFSRPFAYTYQAYDIISYYIIKAEARVGFSGSKPPYRDLFKKYNLTISLN